MADLDDFFAKKDKKKNKAKKFMTTEEIAKKLEETGKRAEKPKKDKPTIQPPSSGPDTDELSGGALEDEEWKDFEEEKKDYTGLKIQNLTLQDFDEIDSNEGENEGEMEENEQGEMVPKKKGPWKVIEHSDGVSQNNSGGPVEKKVTIQETSSPSTTKSQNYIPPYLRLQQQQQQQTNTRERSARGKTGAPDITNQEYFPTLSAASSNEISGPWGRRKYEAAFEEVRNSKSHSNRLDSSRQPQSLQIDSCSTEDV